MVQRMSMGMNEYVYVCITTSVVRMNESTSSSVTKRDDDDKDNMGSKGRVQRDMTDDR